MHRIEAAASFVTVFFLASCSGPVASQPKQNAPAKAAPARITQFYAAPPHPHQGEKTLLCYGVENATAVRIDPPVDTLWPAQSRCFELTPVKAGKYTLTAAGAGGSASQSIDLQIAAPAVHIIEVSINKLDFAPGETATVCYKARSAMNVSIRPGTWMEPHTPDNGCISDRPQHNTTYVVTATGAGGDTDVERVTARVK